jgi:hypothetical protein
MYSVLRCAVTYELEQAVISGSWEPKVLWRFRNGSTVTLTFVYSKKSEEKKQHYTAWIFADLSVAKKLEKTDKQKKELIQKDF